MSWRQEIHRLIIIIIIITSDNSNAGLVEIFSVPLKITQTLIKKKKKKRKQKHSIY